VGNSSFVDCGVNGPLYDQRDVLMIASYGLSRECYFSKSEGPRLSLLGAAEHVKASFGVTRAVCIAAQIDLVGNGRGEAF
jgi:hypothetical protein